MDYKGLIIMMVQNMKNEDYLRKIYFFVKFIFEKDRGH